MPSAGAHTGSISHYLTNGLITYAKLYGCCIIMLKLLSMLVLSSFLLVVVLLLYEVHSSSKRCLKHGQDYAASDRAINSASVDCKLMHSWRFDFQKFKSLPKNIVWPDIDLESRLPPKSASLNAETFNNVFFPLPVPLELKLPISFELRIISVSIAIVIFQSPWCTQMGQYALIFPNAFLTWRVGSPVRNRILQNPDPDLRRWHNTEMIQPMHVWN